MLRALTFWLYWPGPENFLYIGLTKGRKCDNIGLSKEREENNMTTLRGLTQAIYYFYRQLGVTDVKILHSNEFCYWEGFCNSYIEYSLSPADRDCLLGYYDFFEKYYPTWQKEYPCSFFTFSLLHELGHHLTMPFANPAYLDRSRKAIERLAVKENMSLRKKQARYCELYAEKMANDKAIELIENNYNIILAFEKRLRKLIA